MRGWIRGALIAAAGVAACKFTPNPNSVDGASPPADAGPCQELSATCADPTTLRVCSVIDMAPADKTCPWGCVGPDAHCGTLLPSGSGASADDVTNDAQLLDVTVTDDIDGTDGTIKGSLRGSGLGIISGIDYKLVNGYAVFRAKSWRFETHDMNVVGKYPIVLVAIDDIAVDQLIDARGKCTTNLAGPGGFVGSTMNGVDAVGSGGGKAGTGGDSNGGGGGGHGGNGGPGGGAAAVAGGAAFGDLTLATLVGGGGGGVGADSGTGIGGGGGGAIQLVAGGMITIGASGDINAGGCGGTHGDNNDSGGGGGAGGAILLEAHDIVVMGSLTVNGGGGGPGGGGSSGSRGSPNRTRALGGSGGDGLGGSGGAGSGLDGLVGVTGSHSGGGGGGIGIMRINTWSGSANVPDPSLLSPNFDDPGTTTSQGSAHVQ